MTTDSWLAISHPAEIRFSFISYLILDSEEAGLRSNIHLLKVRLVAVVSIPNLTYYMCDLWVDYHKRKLEPRKHKIGNDL